jgi:membrane protease subunit HflK
VTLQNTAYASRIVPEARGNAERILQGAKGFQLQTVAEAVGQTARFLKIQEEYTKAPDVTRTRLYLETMERVFGSADKIIVDSNLRVVPYLSLGPLQERKQCDNRRPTQ